MGCFTSMEIYIIRERIFSGSLTIFGASAPKAQNG
jgi:hypothetical protein